MRAKDGKALLPIFRYGSFLVAAWTKVEACSLMNDKFQWERCLVTPTEIRRVKHCGAKGLPRVL